MPRWIEFSFRTFWDVPRDIVLTVDGVHLHLYSRFLVADDDYDRNYDVFAITPEDHAAACAHDAAWLAASRIAA